MANDDTDQLTRRQAMAGLGAAAVATAAGAAMARAEGSPGGGSDAASSKRGKPDEPDLKNLILAHENPSAFDPPAIDSGDVKPFWYSFELGHNKVSDGGWALQVTVKDLPISTTIAGVNMRLKRGAVRELHWHQSGEWAYMLYGRSGLATRRRNWSRPT